MNHMNNNTIIFPFHFQEIIFTKRKQIWKGPEVQHIQKQKEPSKKTKTKQNFKLAD